MSSRPEDTSAESALLIERLFAGELPREVVSLAARGFLPLSQEQLVGVLVHLALGDDAEIAALARETLQDVPPRAVISFARSAGTDAAQLDELARFTDDATVLEALLRNRATPDATVEGLARRVSQSLQEVIIINQERVIRTPAILDSLLENPDLSSDVRRRIGEVREEFFEKPKRAEELRAAEVEEREEELLSAEQQAELDKLIAEAGADADAVLPTGEEPPSLDPDSESIWKRLSKMTVAQKVQRAYKGSMTERAILVKERNRLIAGAVVRNPRVTDTEVETYAGLRNVEEEVLRLIGMNRSWMTKYNIMLPLIKNPKAPIGVVLPLIVRLNTKDLKNLSGDRNVSEAVRSTARRLYLQRKK